MELDGDQRTPLLPTVATPTQLLLHGTHAHVRSDEEGARGKPTLSSLLPTPPISSNPAANKPAKWKPRHVTFAKKSLQRSYSVQDPVSARWRAQTSVRTDATARKKG